jgi:hypothetical protein
MGKSQRVWPWLQKTVFCLTKYLDIQATIEETVKVSKAIHLCEGKKQLPKCATRMLLAEYFLCKADEQLQG